MVPGEVVEVQVVEAAVDPVGLEVEQDRAGELELAAEVLGEPEESREEAMRPRRREDG